MKRIALAFAAIIALAIPAMAQTAPSSVTLPGPVPSGDAQTCTYFWSPTVGQLINCGVIPDAASVPFFEAYGAVGSSYGAALGPSGSGFKSDGTVYIAANPSANPPTAAVTRAATSADYQAVMKAFAGGFATGIANAISQFELHLQQSTITAPSIGITAQ